MYFIIKQKSTNIYIKKLRLDSYYNNSTSNILEIFSYTHNIESAKLFKNTGLKTLIKRYSRRRRIEDFDNNFTIVQVNLVQSKSLTASIVRHNSYNNYKYYLTDLDIVTNTKLETYETPEEEVLDL